jgi:hypothetical protein
MKRISPARLHLAWSFALAHWLLLVLIQCEEILGCLLPSQSPGVTATGFFLALPFLQTENLLLAVAVGLAASLLAGRKATRLLALALWTLLAYYLVFDQVYYKVFFDHFRPSILAGTSRVNAAQLAGSIGSELDATAYFNVGVVLIVAALLARRFLSRPVGAGTVVPVPPARAMWVLPSVVAALAVAGIPSLAAPRYFNLQRHPLVVMAHDALGRSLIAELRDGGRRAAGPVAALEALPADRDPRLAEVARACRAGARPPNVLLIVLESVGARQLLDGEGLPSAWLVPHLARLARGGVVFDSVYSVFPGSVRAHVAMTTGGRHLTWGSVYELLGYPTGARRCRAASPPAATPRPSSPASGSIARTWPPSWAEWVMTPSTTSARTGRTTTRTS